MFLVFKEPLIYFSLQNAFDHEEAQKEGRIIPSSGVDPDYDRAVSEYDDIKSELDAYLKTQCSHFGCKVCALNIFLFNNNKY